MTTMNSVLRLASGAGACVLVLFGLTLFPAESDSCDWAPAARPDSQDASDFEIERGAILDQRLACMHHVLSVKEKIVRDLIVGDVTLADAGEQFHELERITPGANHRVFQAAYAGLTDPERYCRQVIDRAVQSHLPNPLDEGELRSRLEKEYARQFSRAPLTATE
jgi:hypothetical protein